MTNNWIKINSTKLVSSLIGIVVCVCLIYTPVSFSAIEAVVFEDPVQQKRYQDLIAELRCLVCQNQNLADSDAELAKDLRIKTEEMIKAGKSDQEVLDYMRDRYGDFVLYRPPLNAATALLWIGPFVLLLVAGSAILLNIRRRANNELIKPTQAIDEENRTKIRNLMKSAPELKPTDKNPD